MNNHLKRAYKIGADKATAEVLKKVRQDPKLEEQSAFDVNLSGTPNMPTDLRTGYQPYAPTDDVGGVVNLRWKF